MIQMTETELIKAIKSFIKKHRKSKHFDRFDITMIIDNCEYKAIYECDGVFLE